MPNVKNILAGPVRVFIGAAATAATPDVLPADTVLFGAAWGGTWREVGYTTEDGAHVLLGQTYNEVVTAQERVPVLQLFAAAADRVSFAALEATLANIRDAIGRGAITTVAPGAQPGHDDLTLTDPATVRYVAVGLEGVAPPNDKSNPRRVIFPVALAVSEVDMQMHITSPVGIPMEFRRVGSTAGTPVIRDVTTT